MDSGTDTCSGSHCVQNSFLPQAAQAHVRRRSAATMQRLQNPTARLTSKGATGAGSRSLAHSLTTSHGVHLFWATASAAAAAAGAAAGKASNNTLTHSLTHLRDEATRAALKRSRLMLQVQESAAGEAAWKAPAALLCLSTHGTRSPGDRPVVAVSRSSLAGRAWLVQDARSLPLTHSCAILWMQEQARSDSRTFA